MRRSARLPNAPLAEVVFELRWELQGEGSFPPPFRVDPGYHILADSFSSAARQAGLRYQRQMEREHPPPAYSIDQRFFPTPEKMFPIWQIGPGIFAANESSDYEWQSFKSFALKGVAALIRAYPKLRTFSLRPSWLELRYIDVLDPNLVGAQNFLEFTDAGTNMHFSLPNFFGEHKALRTNRLGGRIRLEATLSTPKESLFFVDYATGERDGQNILRLESKVSTPRGPGGFPPVRRQQEFLKKVAGWLESAHETTSPFFRSFVKAELMEHFRK